MNKIYKVVWSKVKNCYVVVSEIAKNVITGSVKSAKIGSTPMAKGLALGAMMAFVITGSAMANEVITTDKTITGGVYVENNGAANPAKGGALQIVSSNVTIEGSYFEANHATERGASIHTGEGAEVTITNSEFRDHKLVNYGTAQKPKMKPYGAIYAQSGSTITLDGVVFDGNDTTCVHLDDSELIFKGSNAFLNTNNNAIVMTDGDQDLVNTQPILTFAQNSNTLFSGGSGYDFGTTKNFGVINVESGATVVSEGGFTLHDDTEVNLAGTVELGANNTTVIGVLKGEDGTIAVDSEWFGTGKKALNIKVNESTGTVIKVRDLDLKGGAANVLAGVVDDLKDVVDNTGSELVFATAAVDSVLRGDVELKDDKVTTTMDTDDLVVKGDVKATTFNGIKVEDLAKIEYVNAELSKKVDNKAVGQNAIAMGFNAKATGNDSAALGYGAEADNFAATAIGREASASGHSATAIGENASATGSYGNAIGFNATADASSANAMGAYAKATGGNSIAIGSVGKSDAPSTEALDQYAIAIGSSAKAKKANAIAVGQLSLAGRNSIAIGQGTVADAGGDDVAVAIGYQASATKDGAIAVGRFANAAGNSSVAFGASTTAVEPRTTAIGYKAQATYRSDLALGSHAITDKVHSVDSVNIGGKAYIVAGINNDESFVAAASFGGGASGTASDDKTIYRQLQYVAAGQVDKDSTDAVNGSQLFAAYEAIEASVADVTVLEEKTQNITAAEGKTTFATKGDGKITIKDIAGNTMLYGTNADGKYTVGINAQTGGIDADSNIRIGATAFNEDGIATAYAFEANNAGAVVRGGFTVDGNQAITGGLNVGTDVVANGDVKAGAVSLKETAEALNDKADVADVTVLEEKTQNITAAEGKTTFATKGDGKITIKDIAGNTMLYGTNADGKYTVGINAQTGGIDADSNIRIGATAFNEDGIATAYAFEANNAGAVVRGGFTVDGNQAITGGLNVGTDVVATGDVKAGEVSLRATAQKVETNASAIEANKTAIENNASAIEANKTAIETNASAIEANKTAIETNASAIEANKTAIENNASAIEANKTAIETNASAIEANKTAIETNASAIEANKTAIETNASAIEANKTAIETNASAIQNMQNSMDAALDNVYTKAEADERFVQVTTDAEGNTTTEVSENFVVDCYGDEGANVTINGGKDGQITIDTNGQMVFGTNSTAIDSKGVYAGRIDTTGAHDFANAKAGINEDGEIKGASGKFTVDKDGNVQAETYNGVEISKDATTGNAVIDGVDIKNAATAVNDNAQAITGLNQRLGKMNGKINKVGAGAAALAALHPLEYDPDDKLTFSAGVGNYNGENAAALGAFYRPDEKLMFSLGGTMGNGENMVNLGVSIGLDGAKGGAKLSKKELIQKVSTMEAENAAIKAENDALEDRVAKLEALVAKLAEK